MMEFVLTGIIIMICVLIFSYLQGRRLWGALQMNKGQYFIFRTYLLMNRAKLFGRKELKIALLLHLVKIYKEIVLLDTQFNKAKEIFDSRTKYELIDVFDDKTGNRYVKIRIEKDGEFIFEIKEIIHAALKKEYVDDVLRTAPPDASKETIEELKRKPQLRIIK